MWGHTPFGWLFSFGQDKGGTHSTDKAGTDKLKTERMAKYTCGAMVRYAQLKKCGCKPNAWSAATEYDVWRFSMVEVEFPLNHIADIDGDVGGGIKDAILASPGVLEQKAGILGIPLRVK